MKYLLILICLFLIAPAKAQSDWAAVKIGSTDLSKIYVGSSLVWEKGCTYGDLADYDQSNPFWYRYASEVCSTSYDPFVSLVEVKAALDEDRSGLCTDGEASGYTYWYITLTTSSYVLKTTPSTSEPDCALGVDGWYYLGYDLTLGNTPIVQISSGVINYIEYY